MKKINSIVTLMVIMLITNISLAQTIHNAKVMGIIPIGQKDVAMILDETTQEIYKTSIYDRDLLTIEENIELEIKPNEKAKVRKPNLNANIMAFKKVIESDDLSGLEERLLITKNPSLLESEDLLVKEFVKSKKFSNYKNKFGDSYQIKNAFLIEYEGISTIQDLIFEMKTEDDNNTRVIFATRYSFLNEGGGRFTRYSSIVSEIIFRPNLNNGIFINYDLDSKSQKSVISAYPGIFVDGNLVIDWADSDYIPLVSPLDKCKKDMLAARSANTQLQCDIIQNMSFGADLCAWFEGRLCEAATTSYPNLDSYLDSLLLSKAMKHDKIKAIAHPATGGYTVADVVNNFGNY